MLSSTSASEAVMLQQLGIDESVAMRVTITSALVVSTPFMMLLGLGRKCLM